MGVADEAEGVEDIVNDWILFTVKYQIGQQGLLYTLCGTIGLAGVRFKLLVWVCEYESCGGIFFKL